MEGWSQRVIVKGSIWFWSLECIWRFVKKFICQKSFNLIIGPLKCIYDFETCKKMEYNIQIIIWWISARILHKLYTGFRFITYIDFWYKVIYLNIRIRMCITCCYFILFLEFTTRRMYKHPEIYLKKMWYICKQIVRWGNFNNFEESLYLSYDNQYYMYTVYLTMHGSFSCIK